MQKKKQPITYEMVYNLVSILFWVGFCFNFLLNLNVTLTKEYIEMGT